MPVRRGHVAPRTTLIETIIRKFDTDSKYTISNWFYFITSTTLMCLNGRWRSMAFGRWPGNGVAELSSTFAIAMSRVSSDSFWHFHRLRNVYRLCTRDWIEINVKRFDAIRLIMFLLWTHIAVWNFIELSMNVKSNYYQIILCLSYETQNELFSNKLITLSQWMGMGTGEVAWEIAIAHGQWRKKSIYSEEKSLIENRLWIQSCEQRFHFLFLFHVYQTIKSETMVQYSNQTIV